MERRGAGSNSSLYGQACVQCYKAKCRCARPEGGGSCERCTRLRKQCQPSESTRKRGNDSSAQIAKLEGKIEALTSMLQSVVKATGVQETATTLTPPIMDFWDAARPRDNATASTNHTADVPSEQISSLDPSHSPDMGSLSTEAFPHPFPMMPDAPTPDETDIHLSRFRERSLPCFPFMNIRSGVSAHEFRRERPFLFCAIEAVTTPSVQQKAARIEKLKQTLTKAIILENQSNLDMLQSLLTYITWSTDPFLKRASNLSRMMMLAISLVYDLQLTKPNSSPESYYIAKLAPGLTETDQKSPAYSIEDALEQHRAVLACFALSSIISTYLRRIDSMQWTSQMEDAIRFIQNNSERPSDEGFVFQVRLQALAQKVAHVREQHVGNNSQSRSVAAAAAGPVLLYTKVLREQLEELRNSLSLGVEQREILLVYAHYVDLCISEATRLASSEAPLLTGNQSSGVSGGGLSGFEKIDCLWRSVYAVKSWLDTWYSVTPSTYVGAPFFYWFQLVRCIVLAKHLATFQDPAWDSQTVYDTFDLIGTLRWLATKIETASKEAGEQSDDDLFRRLARMLRNCLAWIDAKRDAADGQTVSSAYVLTQPKENSVTRSNDSAWMEGVQIGDDAWFEQYLGWSPGDLGP
ncbi:hypothetical protein GGR57DRAFT_259965 [Xylariaceae sp. FL1272]|nr:hypothetical protein GGR57DRAFT_259965 [Xylariaceae sp. FL1272]